MGTKIRPSPLGLAVLGLLAAGPLHPYGMQRLIKLWGKDQVVNVGQRANLYRVINRLHEAGLISVLQTERNQQFPERTVYQLTEAGHETAKEWLVGMLGTPRREYPEFPAALSFAMGLSPEELAEVLAQRAQEVRETLERLEGELTEVGGTLPRVVLLEGEYLRAVTAAELEWLCAVVEDLRTGALHWGAEMADLALAEIAEAGLSASDLTAD